MTPQRPLRVLAIDPGIAGGYACRLLADAGAGISVLVPAHGLELMRWSASGTDAARGLLFEHLLGDAEQVRLTDADWPSVLASADVVLVDLATGGSETLDEPLRTAVRAGTDAVVVTISPFGDADPVAHPRETEFTFQARGGSIGGRGNPGERPVAAGGRVGEWTTGVFAAISCLAGLEQRRSSGGSAAVNVSMFECVVSIFDCFEWLRGGFFDPPRQLEPWLDIPSAERAGDGWVGITAITPDQWRAFVDLTQAEEFRGDRSIELLLNRVGMRERLDQVCGPWLRAHTVDEVLAEAERRRIPSAPVLNGATVLEADHFRARATFESSADGRFQRPASPIIIDGRRSSAAEAGPLADWRGLAAAGSSAESGPLSGLRVLDLAAFWAGPGAAQILGHLGASVIKVEGVSRPDGMRLVSPRGREVDKWWEYNGIFHGANAGKLGVSVDLGKEGGRELLYRLADQADVLVENSPPQVMDRLGVRYEELSRRNPGIVMLRMPAFGVTGPWRDRRGYATTMDHVSGLAWVTGESSGPPLAAKVADLNGGCHGAFAVLTALGRRAVTGKGALIEVALADAALAITAEQVIEYTGAGVLLTRAGGHDIAAAPQGLYASDDGVWVAVSVTDDGQWERFARRLELPDEARGPRLATHRQRLGARDELDSLLADRLSRLPADQIIEYARAAGAAAERVVSPSAVDQDPELLKTGFIRTLDHPLHGPLNYTTLPFTIDSRRFGPSTPAPMFGEHNRLLPELAHVDEATIQQLRGAGAVSDEPAF